MSHEVQPSPAISRLLGFARLIAEASGLPQPGGPQTRPSPQPSKETLAAPTRLTGRQHSLQRVHCPAAVLSARGAQSCVAKTAGFDGARVDRGLLDGRVGVQQVWEVVRSAAVMGGDEAGIKPSPDDAGAMQAMALQPAPEEDIPGKCGRNPLAAKLRKPGARMRGVADLVMKTPLCGCLIQALRDPLDDYESAAGSEHVANVVKNIAGIRDVVERKAGYHGIQRSIWHVVLEGDPSIPRSLRRLGIDTHGVVADVKKGREVPARFPAP